ncbi:MAG TPA: aminopeptidase [Candidatus Paceibacterota bacterium]|nr:aminopeptidase [Candidatus Paceibacterota bacterium]
MDYVPPKKILERYADVMVNFALGNGRGLKKGETVYLIVNEYAKPLYAELLKAIIKAGGNVIPSYLPDDADRYNTGRDFFSLASEEQLNFFPAKYYKGLVDQCDHSLYIIANTNPHALKGVDPKKIMLRGKAMKPYMDWRREKENKGKFTWTLALYGTPAAAAEAGISLEEYWQEIIKACFLDKSDAVARWKKVSGQIQDYSQKLTDLKIDRVHVEGKDVDLWVKIGEKRKWIGGRGANIPSFEIFTSPDWRGTEGWIKFDQPLYRYGNLIEGIELEFKNGKVVKSKAKKNEKVLREMIATEGADQVGEFSLTDRRFSRISRFMAETLYDENFGGDHGNTHIALGSSYHDCYAGNPDKVTKQGWSKLGFNDSSVHTDIISTTDRAVTAYLPNGKSLAIYQDGQFKI